MTNKHKGQCESINKRGGCFFLNKHTYAQVNK